MRTLILIIIVSALFSPTTVFAASPFASAASDAMAKRFASDPAKATVYVYRDQRFLGSQAVLPVIVDGRIAGTTAPRSYFMWRLEPGRHTISSLTPENEAIIELTAQAGKIYFIRQKARFGVNNPGVSLQQTSAEKGRAAVLKCQRLKSAI